MVNVLLTFPKPNDLVGISTIDAMSPSEATVINYLADFNSSQNFIAHNKQIRKTELKIIIFL